MAVSSLLHTRLNGNSSATWLVKNTTHTAANNEAILADTSAGPWTLTLPATPAAGDSVTVVDYKGYFAVNNLTLGRSSVNIEGAAADFVCSESGASYVWIYTGATLGWRIFSLSVSKGTPYPLGYIDGLILSNNSTDGVDVAIGCCRCSTNVCNFDLRAAFSNKVLANTWAAGSGSNGLDTGAVAASTWYYVWMLRKDADGTLDVLFSASATAPTLPSGYTRHRRIGSVWRNAGGDIEPFIQVADSFFFATPFRGLSLPNPGDFSASTVARAPGTPTLIRTVPLMTFVANGGGHNSHRAGYSGITTLANTMLDLTSHQNTVAHISSCQSYIITSDIGQILTRANSGSTTLIIYLFGWIDNRGKR